MYNRFFKRPLDCSIASILLFLLSPLYIVAGLAVLTSSGPPVLFDGERLGRSKIPFKMYKFRTMTVGAPDVRNTDGSTHSSTDDPRVTGIGRILRAGSVDELPQLFNVLRGDMSLVGPRPSPLGNEARYPEWYVPKFSARPGVTGLSQVKRRNSGSIEARMRDDIEYVENISLYGDLRILVATIGVVLARRGINRQ